MVNKDKFEELFDESLKGSEDAFEKINSILLDVFDKASNGNEYAGLQDCIDNEVKKMNKKCMYIAFGKKNEDLYVVIQFQNKDGNIVEDSRFKTFIYKQEGCEDIPMVSIGCIKKIQELAYCGYELMQPQYNKMLKLK